MVLMVVACSLLGLQHLFLDHDGHLGMEGIWARQKATADANLLHSWVPLILSIDTLIFFTIGNVMIRKLSNRGFESPQLSYNPMLILNLLLLIAGIIYFSTSAPVHVFNLKIFI